LRLHPLICLCAMLDVADSQLFALYRISPMSQISTARKMAGFYFFQDLYYKCRPNNRVGLLTDAWCFLLAEQGAGL
jgi:hypothetical protein